MNKSPQTGELALAPCGPVDRLLARVKVARADTPRLLPRAATTALAVWLPLLVLVVVESNPQTRVSFFRDIAVHVRFLLIVPLLIFAEGSIGPRTRLVSAQFLASGLIADQDADRFESAMRRGRRLLDSTLAEIAIMVVSGLAAWGRARLALGESTNLWFERDTAAGHELTPAGWWHFAVAVPILTFLLLRWAWRYGVWWWFLGRVARLDLRLTASHPDRVGGLGFVTFHQAVFAIITLAVGCLVSASAADRILNGHAPLTSMHAEILHQQIPPEFLVTLAIAALGVVIGVCPMLVFTRRLVAAKRRGVLMYSHLASDYVRMFEQKWMGNPPLRDELLGTSDIQSLADIGGSFERMAQMRGFAIDKRLIMAFAVAAVAPALPLLLTIMPFKEIVRVLFKALI
jgi:hypothetical protein